MSSRLDCEGKGDCGKRPRKMRGIYSGESQPSAIENSISDVVKGTRISKPESWFAIENGKRVSIARSGNYVLLVISVSEDMDHTL